MSFTLYVMALEEPFTEAQLLAAFGEFASPGPLGSILVRYDEQNECTVDCTFDDRRTTDSFSVHRPCGDDRLLQALHRLLLARPSFMTYPAEETVCIVASPASAVAVRKQYPELADSVRVCATATELAADW